MNKISEKVVWDKLVQSEDEKETSPASFGQPAQAQMMFCYNCSQVAPADSAFCPWCRTKLFVSCPKCGNKYSSQYPICNQCGTDRESYVKQQKNKRKKKEAQLKDEKLREQKLNDILQDSRKKRKQKQLEKIRQERHIRKTEEYIETLDYILKMFKDRHMSLVRVQIVFICVILLFAVIDVVLYAFGDDLIVREYNVDISSLVDNLSFIIAWTSIVSLTTLPLVLWLISFSSKSRSKYIDRYIRKHKVNPRLEQMVAVVIDNLNELGNASYNKILKCVPKLIPTSYKSVNKGLMNDQS